MALIDARPETLFRNNITGIRAAASWTQFVPASAEVAAHQARVEAAAKLAAERRESGKGLHRMQENLGRLALAKAGNVLEAIASPLVRFGGKVLRAVGLHPEQFAARDKAKIEQDAQAYYARIDAVLAVEKVVTVRVSQPERFPTEPVMFAGYQPGEVAQLLAQARSTDEGYGDVDYSGERLTLIDKGQ